MEPLPVGANFRRAKTLWEIEALAARADGVPWEESFESAPRLGLDAEATPLDVPLHPGAAQWYREQGISV